MRSSPLGCFACAVGTAGKTRTVDGAPASNDVTSNGAFALVRVHPEPIDMGRIAFLIDSEYEDSEFLGPYDALRGAGHECRVVGITRGLRLVGKRGESHADVEESAISADARRFDAIVIPGGQSPDRLCGDPGPAAFVRRCVDHGMPIAAICNGPRLLVEADAVRGRTLTSWIAARPRLRLAGATWVDSEVVEDGNLITSRKPSDIPSFLAALERQLHRKAGELRGRVAHPLRCDVRVHESFTGHQGGEVGCCEAQVSASGDPLP